MIISPKKMKQILEIGEYKSQIYKTIWRTGEFLVDKAPVAESDGSVILNPDTLLSLIDEWETTIPTFLRSWDFDNQPILSEDFKKNYRVIHFKILHGYEINGVRNP